MNQPSPIAVQHVRALARVYRVSWSSDGGWLLVDDFVLPPDYNVPTTQVLAALPPDYPMRPPGILPFGLWLTRGLLYRGRRLYNLVDGPGPGWGSWSWVCLTRIDWRTTDDLFRVLEIVRTVLSNPNVW